MTQLLANSGGIVIEAALVILFLLLLTVDMMGKTNDGRVETTALIGLIVITIVAFFGRADGRLAWNGMVILDDTSLWFKRLFLLGALGVSLMVRWEKGTEARRGGLYPLIVVATLGMCLLVSSHHFILLFISLELVTVSFYVLVAYGTGSMEAGIKYLVIGTVSAAVFLMGTSFVYGGTGSLDFDVVAGSLATSATPLELPMIAGMVLVLLGIAFKVAAVPFHSWAPDVYEGAPTPVVAFLSVGSKAAGFGVLLRLLCSVFSPAGGVWSLLVLAVTPVTLFFGNLGAIPQTDIKRLLGYSSIAQSGYLLLGIAAGNVLGGTAIVYYLYAYLFSALLAFTVVAIFASGAGGSRIADYAGLSKRSPVLAGSMLIALLSLAGVPPLAGFFGKFLLIGSVLQAGDVWLAVVGVINIAVALYYYLLVIKMMYIRPPAEGSPIAVSLRTKLLLYALMTVIVLLGVFQEPLVEISQGISAGLFKSQGF
jgi:NADH-quinone oxidoreductase subunit N